MGRVCKDAGEGFIYMDYVNNIILVCAHNDVVQLLSSMTPATFDSFFTSARTKIPT